MSLGNRELFVCLVAKDLAGMKVGMRESPLERREVQSSRKRERESVWEERATRASCMICRIEME